GTACRGGHRAGAAGISPRSAPARNIYADADRREHAALQSRLSRVWASGAGVLGPPGSRARPEPDRSRRFPHRHGPQRAPGFLSVTGAGVKAIAIRAPWL